MVNPETVDIVFDGPPGPKSGRFVEVETPDGRSISLGKWYERDGYWRLRIRKEDLIPSRSETVKKIQFFCMGFIAGDLLVLGAFFLF